MMLTIEVLRDANIPDGPIYHTRQYDYVVKHDTTVLTYGRVVHDPMQGWERLVELILQQERCEGNE